MASVNELVGHFQSAIEKINEAMGSVSSAESGASELQSMLASAGVEDRAQQVAAVSEAAARLRQYLQGGVEQAQQSLAQAKAISG